MKNNNDNNENKKVRMNALFQTEEYIDLKKIPWYRQTWVILTFLFTPLFPLGIYFIITQKHYTTFFKGMVIFFFLLAFTVTILQMNGIDMMENMPFYQYKVEE